VQRFLLLNEDDLTEAQLKEKTVRLAVLNEIINFTNEKSRQNLMFTLIGSGNIKALETFLEEKKPEKFENPSDNHGTNESLEEKGPEPIKNKDFMNITGGSGMSPLYCAVKNNREDIVHLLLANGADPRIQNVNKQTLLHLA